jgi:aminoglycoside phosphotransferase/GTP:adenosylcobinamide-phosphate guanylyltransferase
MDIDYIIVQAGGKGSRLEKLTANKPKCLVPVDNLPILFHLFRRYPRKKFIIIGDYLYGVLEKYLEAFAEAPYVTVHAEGNGTCGGLSQALALVPGKTPFMLIWSDLILAPGFSLDGIAEADYMGISKDFECRWSFTEGVFKEEASVENGVAGVFIFRDKKALEHIPGSGEFACFLSGIGGEFQNLSLEGTREIGTLAGMETLSAAREYRCRPFNRLEISGDTVTKIPVDDQGRKLAARERAWYREAGKLGFNCVPRIRSLDPLVMERSKGRAIFRAELNDAEKKTVIDAIIGSLESLHGLKSAPCDIYSIMEAYYTKTLKRLERVRDLIPFADRKTIVINGAPCRNIYFYRDEFRRLTEKLLYTTQFALIHGDCTFSNTMVDENLEITFLDPRGYFGFTELYGDIAYDWAKVFYSINGDYDQFNNGNFALDVGSEEVTLKIAPGGWKDLSGYYLAKVPGCSPRRIRFIHAIIWLSLTTYAWEDYDSICGAFYNGLLLMNEFLEGCGS